MKKLGKVFLPFRIEGESEISGIALEVSLDCATCQRRARTVTFSGIGMNGICHPTKHEFSGRVTDTIKVEDGLEFHIEYEYEPFVDTKYPDERRYQNMEKGSITWARVSLRKKCLSCGKESSISQQTNQDKFFLLVCDCGVTLSRGTGPVELTSWNA